jgi:lipopolysaccharide export system protein LptA
MDFNEHNQPRRGHLEGGVILDSKRPAKNGGGLQEMHGTAPVAELEFTDKGELRHTHLERGVEIRSDQFGETATGPLRVSRTWKSPLADVDFRDNGHGQAEPATIHGTQGVVITGESQRGKAAPVPSKLSADEVMGAFGPDSTLTAMTGTGHASLEETNAAGTRQSAAGDRLDAHFSQVGAKGGAGQVQSAVLDGHVVLLQEPLQRPAGQNGAQAAAPLKAWAGHAAYDSDGEWLHLTQSPRVEDGPMQMTADKIDVSHESGDAFAHGNVKATWLNANADRSGRQGIGQNGAAGPGRGDATLGGQGPTHVISSEAQLHQASQEATFRGHARMWQQANSVAAPLIVLDRQKLTLVARSADQAEPVKAVLLSTGGLEPGSSPGKQAGGDVKGKSSTPSLIRVRGGDLKYSDAERRAVMRGGALGTVVAETVTATSVSNDVELLLLPPGNHAGKDGGQAQVDRMTARGHVVVTSQGRRGTGEQLVYTGETGEYMLTGTAATPPRMTDPARGYVTGDVLIFHSRDDSVSIEGGGRRTTTETTAPK